MLFFYQAAPERDSLFQKGLQGETKMSLDGVCLEEERRANSPQKKENSKLIFCMTYLDNFPYT